MNIIQKLKRAIGLAEAFENEGGYMDDYKKHLVHNARKKLKNRQRDAVQKKSRKINARRKKAKRKGRRR